MSRGKGMYRPFQDAESETTDSMFAMLRLDTFFNASDYTSADERKKLVELVFEHTRKALESVGREEARKDIDKRKRAVIKSFDRVVDAFKSLDLRSVEESFVSFEALCLYDYDMIDDVGNYSLAAALWVLEDLRRTGKLHDAYCFLPKSMMQMEDVYMPIDFYHPCYDQDLIRSVAHVISTRNSRTKTTGEFRAVMNLVDADRIKTAIEHFKELQWQALTCFMKAEEYFDQKTEAALKELKNLMNPPVLIVNYPQNIEERKREAMIEESRIEKDRWKFQERFEMCLETGERRISGSRVLGRIMNSFHIDDPFEVCFALIYLCGMDDDAVWLMKAGVSVTIAACRLLPWHYDDSEASDEEFDSWFEGMTYGRENGWLEEKTSDGIDYFHSNKPGEPNPAQRIYRLCRGVVPFGMHPFNRERQQMKEEGIENADLIADWADILFLQSFHAMAANLRRADWFDWDDDEEDETDGISADDKVADAAQETYRSPLKLGGYWGKVAAGQGRKTDTPVANDDTQNRLAQKVSENRALAEELEKAKREIKNLRKSLSTLQHDTDAELAKVEHELKNLRMEHMELADLRELVFNRESNHPAGLEKVKKQIEYPYETKKRTVIFGGHETFLKAIKPMLPTAKFVDVSNYAFNPEIIRNADVVWIQNNCISHSQFWNIVKICKIAGVQMRYFAYASAAKCVEQLVTEDQKIY